MNNSQNDESPDSHIPQNPPDTPDSPEFSTGELIFVVIIMLLIGAGFIKWSNKFLNKNKAIQVKIAAIKNYSEKTKATGHKKISYPGGKSQSLVKTSFQACRGLWDLTDTPEVVLESFENGKTVKRTVPKSSVKVKVISLGTLDGQPPGVPDTIKGRSFHNTTAEPEFYVIYTIPEDIPDNTNVDIIINSSIKYGRIPSPATYTLGYHTVETRDTCQILSPAEARKLGFMDIPEAESVTDLENDIKFNKIKGILLATIGYIFILSGILFATISKQQNKTDEQKKCVNKEINPKK